MIRTLLHSALAAAACAWVVPGAASQVQADEPPQVLPHIDEVPLTGSAPTIGEPIAGEVPIVDDTAYADGLEHAGEIHYEDGHGIGHGGLASRLAARHAAAGQTAYRTSVQGDLFYNYYVPPTYPQGVPAQMYVSPRPVPPHVGWTWYTYQPLYPHEYLYTHQRNYWSYNPGGGYTRTRVKWGHNPLNQLNPVTGRAPFRPVGVDYPRRLWE